MSTGEIAAPATAEDERDLGFGSRVLQQSRERFLNRDGSFNVVREGLPLYRTLNPYHALLTLTWPRFYAVVLAAFVATNVVFAFGYLLCGPGALHGAEGSTLGSFAEAFFFSVQTLATIGYGRISPQGLAANLLMTAEALVGMLGFTLATGLAFARFSRPVAQILFSERAVIAPYRGTTGFMFRIANARTSQLIEVEVKVILARMETRNGQRRRAFHLLPLERHKVTFFPLHLVVVHPIDEQSPLRGVSREELLASEAEFLILLTGIDETFSQTVHRRSSYDADEVVVGAHFKDMYAAPGGRLGVDMRRLHDIEVVAG